MEKMGRSSISGDSSSLSPTHNGGRPGFLVFSTALPGRLKMMEAPPRMGQTLAMAFCLAAQLAAGCRQWRHVPAILICCCSAGALVTVGPCQNATFLGAPQFFRQYEKHPTLLYSWPGTTILKLKCLRRPQRLDIESVSPYRRS